MFKCFKRPRMKPVLSKIDKNRVAASYVTHNANICVMRANIGLILIVTGPSFWWWLMRIISASLIWKHPLYMEARIKYWLCVANGGWSVTIPVRYVFLLNGVSEKTIKRIVNGVPAPKPTPKKDNSFEKRVFTIVVVIGVLGILLGVAMLGAIMGQLIGYW